jgi:DNA-binding PadR family transcriptional regulator
MRMCFRHHRRIGIPKGLLRHIVIQLLKNEPMSGSEIMEQVFEFTDYRPSPGSIYPLLAQLQEEGLVEQSPDEDPNIKRYGLTEGGRRELQEIMMNDNEMKNRQKTIHRIYWRLHRDLPDDLYTSFSRLLDVFDELHFVSLESPEKQTELIKILNEAARSIESLGAEVS